MNNRLNVLDVPEPLRQLDASQYNDWVTAGKWMKQHGYMIQSWSMWSGPWQKVHAPTQDAMVKMWGSFESVASLAEIRAMPDIYQDPAAPEGPDLGDEFWAKAAMKHPATKDTNFNSVLEERLRKFDSATYDGCLQGGFEIHRRGGSVAHWANWIAGDDPMKAEITDWMLEKWQSFNSTPSTTKDTNPKDAVGVRKWRYLSTVSALVWAEVGAAMLEGAVKYGRHNYRVAGVRGSVYYDAAMGHMIQWWEGEDIDKDSGLSHVTKAIASLVVLRDAMINDMLTDDRPPRGNLDATRDHLQTIVDAIFEKYPNPKAAYTIGDRNGDL